MSICCFVVHEFQQSTVVSVPQLFAVVIPTQLLLTISKSRMYKRFLYLWVFSWVWIHDKKPQITLMLPSVAQRVAVARVLATCFAAALALL